MPKLIVFSGAGMSAESGINTFRDSNGLWEQHRVEDVATPEAWAKNPALVQRFYNERRKNILNAQPNAAHQLIAELEQYFDVAVITQNIDDLQERAGSQQVLHLHGNIRLAKTSGPDAQTTTHFYPIEGAELDLERDVCDAGYPLRPHVVWFGEAVPAYVQAIEWVQDADIFIVIGSSLGSTRWLVWFMKFRPAVRPFILTRKPISSIYRRNMSVLLLLQPKVWHS